MRQGWSRRWIGAGAALRPQPPPRPGHGAAVPGLLGARSGCSAAHGPERCPAAAAAAGLCRARLLRGEKPRGEQVGARALWRNAAELGERGFRTPSFQNARTWRCFPFHVWKHPGLTQKLIILKQAVRARCNFETILRTWFKIGCFLCVRPKFHFLLLTHMLTFPGPWEKGSYK